MLHFISSPLPSFLFSSNEYLFLENLNLRFLANFICHCLMMLLQIKHFRDAISKRAQSAVHIRVRVDDAPRVDQELCVEMGVL